MGRHGSNTKKYDNSGLSRAGELHALLKEVRIDTWQYRAGELHALLQEVSREACWFLHPTAVKDIPLYQELNGPQPIPLVLMGSCDKACDQPLGSWFIAPMRANGSHHIILCTLPCARHLAQVLPLAFCTVR